MPIGKQKKNRECPKCHTNSYWKFHLCRNKGCHWYYKIPSAPEDAKKKVEEEVVDEGSGAQGQDAARN